MRALFHLFVFFGAALAVGFGLSYFALEKGRLFGTLRIGPWVAWTEVGAPGPDPYTLAYLSRTNALELARAEGIKFVAEQDSDGLDLRAECSYRIDGNAPESAFWTLVATDKTGTNIVRPGGAKAFQSKRVVHAGDGSFALHFGPIATPGNWLETTGTGSLFLALTLYDSTIFSGFSSLEDSLPSIILEACQ